MFALLGISLRDLYAVPRLDVAVARGQALNARFGCAGCHRVHGEGGQPDRAWHLRHFRDPQSVSPGSIMPKFPLTDGEVNELTSYVLPLKRPALGAP